MAFGVSGADGGGNRGKKLINRFVGSKVPTYAFTITYSHYLYPQPALPLSHPLRPAPALSVMLRANQRPPSILGDDPFSYALKPPAHELDYEKHARLEREIEAKRISDRIDDEIRRDRERFKRSKQDVKVSAYLFAT